MCTSVVSSLGLLGLGTAVGRGQLVPVDVPLAVSTQRQLLQCHLSVNLIHDDSLEMQHRFGDILAEVFWSIYCTWCTTTVCFPKQANPLSFGHPCLCNPRARIRTSQVLSALTKTYILTASTPEPRPGSVLVISRRKGIVRNDSNVQGQSEKVCRCASSSCGYSTPSPPCWYDCKQIV